MVKRLLPLAVVLPVVVLAALMPGAWGSAPPAPAAPPPDTSVDGDEGVDPPAPGADRVEIYSQPGVVQGTLTPKAPFVVEVTYGGVLMNRVTGTTDSVGKYSVVAGWKDESQHSVHNGAVVEVTDRATGQTYTQHAQLAGMLDEHTGRFLGSARPHATVDFDLYAVGNQIDVIARGQSVADAAGTVSFDFAAVHTPKPVADRPPWRGYLTIASARDVDSQKVVRRVQTPNTVLGITQNHAGGGYFLPGDSVVHELWRHGVQRDAVTVTVNPDGVPRATLNADVGDGDVLVTRYTDTAGNRQSIELLPWNLSAIIDPATKTVTGRLDPGAKLSGLMYGEKTENATARGVGGADGSYELRFDHLEADAMLRVWRQADPGFTGIGGHQINLHVPIVQVSTTTAEVSGYGAHGVNTVRVEQRRNGVTVGQATGTSNKNGKFKVGFPVELREDDDVVVVTGPQTLPTYRYGRLFTGYPAGTAASSGSFAGAGESGRTVLVATAACSNESVVAPDGTWAVTLPCAVNPTEPVLFKESVPTGAAAGYYRAMVEEVTEPDVALVAPSPDASVGRSVTLRAEARDHDDAGAVAVYFVVDGKSVGYDDTAPYEVNVSLKRGRRVVQAVAVDAGGRTDASGTPVLSVSPYRYITVN